MTRNFLLQAAKEKSFSITTAGNLLITEQIADFGEPKVSKKELKSADACLQEAEKLAQKKLSEGFEEILLHFPGVPVSTLKEILAARQGLTDSLEIWQAAESDELVEYVCSITTLKKLRFNRIKNLSQSIGNLQLLESLTINESRGLSVIPETIGQLTQLRSLDIGYTAIQGLPPSIGLLSNLRYLSIHGNQHLESMPAETGQLKNLCFLTISHNGQNIEAATLHLPDQLGDLENLERLDLSSNQLSRIPSWIASLSKLEYLEMRENNQIDAIPGFINELKNLYLLDLEACSIKHIPKELCKLPEFKVLNITENKITDIPEKIISKGWEAIKPFLEGTLTEAEYLATQKPPNPNETLLRYYRTAHDTGVPFPLADFISSGRLVEHPPFTFTDKSKHTYKGSFITDMGYRMEGMVDQSIRLAVSEQTGNTEPIGFADVKPIGGTDEFQYQLIVFPRHHINSLQAEDPCPVYLVKYTGHPENDEFYDDDDEDNLEEDEQSDGKAEGSDQEGSFKCETELIADSFEAFLSAITKG
ncbi:leucine-rich repeat domain-containing protein [Paraflavitalea sp. CAU 1676]|uniref:leucine-rich repeat domain-containing protein n=1 Tax=Paraflavitalea sp. CAU 1676 TaxID=3032598 RepID=UPI0023DAE255|nr:leucine-rich repeat domain-containing protein [Paraflavitalea sp. CAU 1676]MDF2190657.1 leucine-rich repeat domain-containing protein [Paraflavitalea sp. CAU 1676]